MPKVGDNITYMIPIRSVDQSPLQKGYDYAEGKIMIIVFAPTEVKAYKCKSCGTVFAVA